jgi:hypothetical protein
LYYSLYILDAGSETLSKELLMFEYISLERLEVPVTNWNDFMMQTICKAGQKWLKF